MHRLPFLNLPGRLLRHSRHLPDRCLDRNNNIVAIFYEMIMFKFIWIRMYKKKKLVFINVRIDAFILIEYNIM